MLRWDLSSSRHVPNLSHQVAIEAINFPETNSTNQPELPVAQSTRAPAAKNPIGHSKGRIGMQVEIVDRHDSSTLYSYVVPGYSRVNANTSVNCFGTENIANCSAGTTAIGSSVPPRPISYEVRGATFALKLPDGRTAVVNCESKYKLKGDYINRRSCRAPIVSSIWVEFDGDKAKLMWPVSIDGDKMESETYKILGILDKP